MNNLNIEDMAFPAWEGIESVLGDISSTKAIVYCELCGQTRMGYCLPYMKTTAGVEFLQQAFRICDQCRRAINGQMEAADKRANGTYKPYIPEGLRTLAVNVDKLTGG